VISNTNQPTIWSTVSNLTLSVNNKGLIDSSYQAIYIYGTLLLANTGTINGTITAANYQDTASLAASAGSQPDVGDSRIINKGLIDAGDSAVAIRLGKGDDFVRNKDTIDGAVKLGGGQDKFFGAKQGEVVYGGAGKDHLNTHGGDDLIEGGRGADVIRPGGGADLIVHNQGDGRDHIFGFKPGKDMIDLSDFDFSDFKDLKSDIAQKGGKVVIDLGSHDQLVLAHVDKADLSAHDFFL
jgi:Ca2+-binding RTX toxin-like protein